MIIYADWKPVSFVCATDAARAKAFYERKLGLPFVSEDNFAVVFDNYGVSLRVSIVPELKPAPYTVLGWRVPDVNTAVDTLVAAGIAMKRFSFLPQDEQGIWTAPDGSRVAWFEDPDGNLLSLQQ